MIGRIGLAAALLLALQPATAEQKQRVDDPPECHWPADQRGDWQACADAATVGSPMHVLANMNLGTQAFLKNNYQAAVRFYDQTFVPGKTIISDAFHQAFRAATLDRVGRVDQALVDARVVLADLDKGQLAPGQRNDRPLTDKDRRILYAAILPALKHGDAPELEKAVEAFVALPTISSMEAGGRAGTLTNIGRYKDALPFSESALKEHPDEPMVLNNHCYLLALMGDGAAAVPYCERALARAPGMPSIHDSLAVALSAAGRCAEAVNERKQAAAIDPASVEYQKPLACEQHR
jgi:tetratricopeptide (TPR) repeat protein